jgi:addiction module HigA family antidote
MLHEEFLKPLGLSQTEAAARMRITTNRLNEIVKGKRGVTADTAWRIAALLGTSPEIWMNLQTQWDLWQAVQAQQTGHPIGTVDILLREAIRHRHLVQFTYQGALRIAEPHDYGVSRGHIRLLVFQIRGRSQGRLPGWRMIDVAEIEDLTVLDEAFRGSRGEPGKMHKQWDELFCRVA